MPRKAVSIFDKTLPHDDEAEKALVGSVLQDRDAAYDAMEVLHGLQSPFFREACNQVWAVAVNFLATDKPLDGVIIRDELIRRGVFEEIGGYPFLADCLNRVPSAKNARKYAEIVRGLHFRRQMIGATYRACNTCYDTKREPGDVIDESLMEVSAVAEQYTTNQTTSGPIDDITVAKAEALRASPEPRVFVPTPFPELNALLNGYTPGELMLVAARPSIGKTGLMLWMAYKLIEAGYPVVFFSLEMSRDSLADRLIAIRGEMNSSDVRRRDGRSFSPESYEAAALWFRQRKEEAGAALWVEDRSGVSIQTLAAAARVMVRRHSPPAVFVDYLQLMKSATARQQRREEVDEISLGLKAIAKDCNVQVVAACQLNRSSERDDRKPTLVDLRESGTLEQDADTALLLHGKRRVKGDDLEMHRDLILAKNRNGETGEFVQYFNMATGRWAPSIKFDGKSLQEPKIYSNGSHRPAPKPKNPKVCGSEIPF